MWQRRYALSVALVDLFAVALSSALYSFWGSADPATIIVGGVVAVVLSGVVLKVAQAWDPAVLGQGSLEFTRLLRAFSAVALIGALASLALQRPEGRPWVFGVLPLAGLAAAVGRLGLRKRLHRRRRAGEAMARVLAVGSEDAVAELIVRTRRAPHQGWLIAGACTPSGTSHDGAPTIDDVPVVGDLDSVAALARGGGYDTVSVAPTAGWTPRRLQQLAWDLEGNAIELVVDPGLMEVAGPRLHVANVDGLPLLRLTHPRFSGFSKLLKGAFDRAASALLLLLFWPLLIGLAVAVRADGGPIFFRQTRVGLGGREFQMIKFRSMVVDAEARLGELRRCNQAAGPMFKIYDDPRVTPVGRVMRRYSLDELPQILNVLTGSMSLVGPRPPLPQEVVDYESSARRRLLVKPGMTGLWQIGGRSDLSWDESIRLDLRYVENWTLALDAQILVKTVRAVLKGCGAY